MQKRPPSHIPSNASSIFNERLSPSLMQSEAVMTSLLLGASSGQRGSRDYATEMRRIDNDDERHISSEVFFLLATIFASPTGNR